MNSTNRDSHLKVDGARVRWHPSQRRVTQTPDTSKPVWRLVEMPLLHLRHIRILDNSTCS